MNVDARRILRTIENLRNLAAGEPFLYLEEHGSALIGRKLFKRLGEASGRLPADRGDIRPGLGRRRLDSRFVRVVARTGKRQQFAPPFPSPLVVDTQVDQHAVKPGRKARAAVESIGRLKQTDKGVLRDIAGVGFIAEDRAGKAVGARLMAFDQLLERLAVVLRDSCAQFLIRKLLQAASPGGRPVARLAFLSEGSSATAQPPMLPSSGYRTEPEAYPFTAVLTTAYGLYCESSVCVNEAGGACV
jgi:hypothetical protein